MDSAVPPYFYCAPSEGYFRQRAGRSLVAGGGMSLSAISGFQKRYLIEGTWQAIPG